MKNVYLIGMMGSGKTSSGKMLARMLSVSFVDLDEQIIKKAGQSINEIFKTKGEPYFRNLESELLLEVSKSADQVVATGGGIVLDLNNRRQMKQTGQVIYLKTSPEILWKRVSGNKNRPLLATLSPQKTLSELFEFRSPLYDDSADQVFVTDYKTPEAVASEIYKACFKHEND